MIERSQEPPRFRDYRSYKPYLRIDFNFRCAYCGITEYRWGSDRNFVVEHFRPKSRFQRLERSYKNLYYACNRCNDFKRDTWPSRSEFARGLRWIDPCASEMYTEHLRELDSGVLETLTPAGEYTAENLMLNLRPYLVTWRRERSQLLADIARSLEIVSKLESTNTTSLGLFRGVQLDFLLVTHRQLCERLQQEY